MTNGTESSGGTEHRENKGYAGKLWPLLAGLTAGLIVVVLVVACAFLILGNGGGGIPVPGHPDWRSVTLPFYYENGTAIAVIENQKAADPSYAPLISFLSDYEGPSGDYETGHVCSSYAVELHDMAESMDINASVVLIYYRGVVDPHMIVAFKTTDKGWIYVDWTGLTPEEQAQGYPGAFRTADVVPGSTYLLHYPNGMAEDTGNVVDRVKMLS
jgi:hypothetical protein